MLQRLPGDSLLTLANLSGAWTESGIVLVYVHGVDVGSFGLNGGNGRGRGEGRLAMAKRGVSEAWEGCSAFKTVRPADGCLDALKEMEFHTKNNAWTN